MKKIDLSTWERNLHYQVFRNSVQPQYCVSFELDITNFLSKIRFLSAALIRKKKRRVLSVIMGFQNQKRRTPENALT